MSRNIIVPLIVIITFSIASCGNSGQAGPGKGKVGTDRISQQADGTISLKLEKASCYSCDTDPSNNTAEWNFVVSKPGRYGVWLSTATTDTMNLQYTSSVKINLQDERLEATPVGNKIILNATDVKYPYFRADSYMGTFYIEQPGEYSIQVINEKVVPVYKGKVSKSRRIPQE